MIPSLSLRRLLGTTGVEPVAMELFVLCLEEHIAWRRKGMGGIMLCWKLT
jgi:hypothetical protein